MSYATRTITFVMSVAMIGVSLGAASAESRWDRTHPWRAEVNARLVMTTSHGPAIALNWQENVVSRQIGR
jgi:hypothetical protein